ncbi:MAG: ATP-binding cassette domain-containing protein [Ruminococcus sp.]|jgi:ABC-2 type transport system ATP-binding protein|nr:ATP-binding cassette domain-containing protein [Ruminococcus sp.]
MQNTILKTNNLTKKFKKQLALNNVSLNISQGDIYGFVGKNGAGKSTLMKIINGLIFANSGEFELFGVPDKSKNILKARRNISGIIESPAFYPHMTAYENLKAQSLAIGKFSRDIVINSLNMVDLENTRKKVRNYSLGMKQRLSIAQAIMNNSKFIILDEPTNGLDPQGILELRELIKKFNRELGVTFLISSHYLDELSQIVNKIGVLKSGSLILEDDMENIRNNLHQNMTVTLNKSDNLSNILAEKLTEYSYEVNGNKVVFSEKLPEIDKLYETFSAHNISITDIDKSSQNLEEYVLNLLN